MRRGQVVQVAMGLLLRVSGEQALSSDPWSNSIREFLNHCNIPIFCNHIKRVILILIKLDLCCIKGHLLPQAKSQEVRGNKEFVATPWLGSADEVEAAAKTANSATPDQTLEASEYEGKLRKTTCNSFGMGMKFQTFEVQRCIDAKVGKEYTMNTCVMTTATYGEKFRPVFKYT